MQVRNTIIVLVLLALVGGYIWFFQSKESPDKTAKLFDIKADDITRIDLKYPDKEIEVERTGGDKWKLVKPIQADADTSAVNTLASEIADCDVKRTVDEHPGDLSLYGLSKPEVTVIAATKKKTLPGVQVGKNTPIGYSAYIKTTDKPAVMLTSAGFGPGTKRTVDDLRDHTLMSFKVDDVRKLTLTRDGTTIEVSKDNGKWQIVKPARYAADSDRVQQLLSAVSNARINQFISDNPANVSKYGLDKPQIALSVFTGPAESRQSLEVGTKTSGDSNNEGYYVRRGERPPVYTIQNWLFADIDKNVNDLRDRTVFAFEPSKVERMKLLNGGQSFALARQAGGKWSETNGTKSEADTVKVEQFMDRIRDLKAESIVADSPTDLAKFGLTSPVEQVTLFSKDGKELGWVKFTKIERRNQDQKSTPAPVQRTDYYAMSSASPTIFKIYEYDYGDLMKTPDQLRAPNARPVPQAKASAASK